MKNFLIVAALGGTVLWGCKDATGEFVDLNSGQKITVEKDQEKGYMVNADTRKAVYLYVDPETRDTFYGRTGRVVNNNITRDGSGMFRYTGDEDYVYKNGDYKVKAEADGDLKVKDGDYKLKVDEDGDMKVKDGDYKKKVEADGDMKIKDGDTKVKVDDGKVKVKKDD
ncbi:hypothetical protein [Aridibaculum aurantiacum]|uniref:hypothetical protein n=1 Tax=Aridibaculum aurantiacum TaxID=2810307 RepID=UPI001A959B75|nr:hypothetical protein [Aridibaculum aurantiacum]